MSSNVWNGLIVPSGTKSHLQKSETKAAKKINKSFSISLKKKRQKIKMLISQFCPKKLSLSISQGKKTFRKLRRRCKQEKSDEKLRGCIPDLRLLSGTSVDPTQARLLPVLPVSDLRSLPRNRRFCHSWDPRNSPWNRKVSSINFRTDSPVGHSQVQELSKYMYRFQLALLVSTKVHLDLCFSTVLSNSDMEMPLFRHVSFENLTKDSKALRENLEEKPFRSPSAS